MILISKPRKNLAGPRSFILNSDLSKAFKFSTSASLLLAIIISSIYTKAATKPPETTFTNKVLSAGDYMKFAPNKTEDKRLYHCLEACFNPYIDFNNLQTGLGGKIVPAGGV